MLADKQKSDTICAELFLYGWACGLATTARTKEMCAAYGFEIDFRQADTGACMDAIYSDGSLVTLYI